MQSVVILAAQRRAGKPLVLGKEEQWTRRLWKLSNSAQEITAKLVEQQRRKAWHSITEN